MRMGIGMVCGVMAAAWIGGAAEAQIGSALVTVPWAEDRHVEATGYYLGLETDIESASDELTLNRAVAFGRARMDTRTRGAPAFGWAYDHLDLDTADERLPERLVAATLAAGVGVGEFDGWEVAASVGGGFAGDTPYSDSDAWYGVASIVLNKQLDPQHSLALFLDYDGSRVIFPDVPLPAFQYWTVVSPRLRYGLGLPFSSLYYNPDNRWSIELAYAVPVGGRARVEYRLGDRWRLFGAYTSSTRGYHLEGDDEHRRLFFSQDRLELGGRYELPRRGLALVLAGGWAFAQEFTRGWDIRDDETVRELDDAPYLRVGLSVEF